MKTWKIYPGNWSCILPTLKGKGGEILKGASWGFISLLSPQYTEIFPHGKLPVSHTPQLLSCYLLSVLPSVAPGTVASASVSLSSWSKSSPSVTQGESLQVGPSNLQFKSPPADSSSALRSGTTALSESNSVPFDTLTGSSMFWNNIRACLDPQAKEGMAEEWQPFNLSCHKIKFEVLH